MRRKQGTGLTALVAGLSMALLIVSSALAAEPTRDEFVARVEPICKANTEANARIFKGAKAEVKAGKLKQAAGRFTRAVVAFDKTIKQVKAIPQPAEDKVKLGKWIGYLEGESSLLGKVGKALAKERKIEAQTYSVRLNNNSNRANNTVLDFGFDYCRIDPSRFS